MAKMEESNSENVREAICNCTDWSRNICEPIPQKWGASTN